MGYLTKTWTPTDAAQMNELEHERDALNADIAGYRRKRGKKVNKAKVQFLSYQDTRKKPSKISWFGGKKKKRKSRLAKQKHHYDGFEGPGEARDNVHQSKKEIINQIGQITGKPRTNQEPNVDYFRKTKKRKKRRKK